MSSDGVHISEIENSEGRESVAAPDPGLSTSDGGVIANTESLAAVAQEVGAVANGSLVNSQEDGTNRAEEEPSGFTNAESSPNTDTRQLSDAAIGGVDEVSIGNLDNDVANPNVVDLPASIDPGSHENSIMINADGPIQDQLVNENQDEDAGKEEMFVDAPDYMTATDGRSTDAREFKAMAETTNNYSANESNDQPTEGENQIQCTADDLAVLHAQLDEAIAEKELVAGECNKYKVEIVLPLKEERELLSREICDFHRQLQALSNQRSLLVECNDGLVDRIRRAEREGNEEKTPASDMPLHTMIGEFSKFLAPLKNALDEQLQSEGTVRELHAVLFTKDQDIEDLNEKLIKLSVSHDVLLSYMESLQKMWTESLQESADYRFHLEIFVERSLASFAPIIPQDDVSNDSVMERISAAEKSIAVLIENHTRFLSEINNLGQCLASVNPDLTQMNEFGVVFEAAREVLLGHKRKELDLLEKVQRLEEENQKLIEELDNSKQRLDEVNADMSKTKMELEQAECKLATSREKLSMAVTKGKALVQQRDALRQSVNEKTNELEKCLLELQLKTSALDVAEANKEEIIKGQHLVSSLEESLSEKSIVLQELDELISQANSPEEIQSLPIVDRVRWLVNQKSMLEGIFLESRKVKDAISFIDLPENISSAALESQIDWLGKSFAHAKDDVSKLQDEIATALDTVASHESQLSEARQEIEQLRGSLSEQKLEKDSLLVRLEDLTCNHNESIEKLSQISSEKEGLVRSLLELSEYKKDDQGNDESSSDTNTLIEMCIGKIKERISVHPDSAFVESDNFQWLQSLIFVIDQELMLWKMMLEEDMLNGPEMAKQSDELRQVSEELDALKTERDSLRKDLERAEEKSSLIREKLSMAVKKGKGLVQERENLKLSLDEKNAQIEKLRQNMQQQDSAINELNDQIKRLSGDLEFIPKLEADANAMREEKGQIKQFLLESNDKLKALVTSIDCTVLPADIVFEDPVDKVKWLVKYVYESEVGKTRSQQELDKANEEVALLASKLADAYATIKSLEDALSQANNNISILVIEKSDAIADKIHAEKKLEEAQEEAHLQAQKLAVANATAKSLEDELSDAEKKNSILDSERRDAEMSKAKVEQELEEVKEEAHLQNSKLVDAHATVKSLEDELSEAEKKNSILDSERRDAEIGKAKIEQELEEVKEEARLQNSKLADAHATIASLNVTLSEAERNISMLGIASKDAEYGKVSVEQELEKARQETDYQTSKLADAYTRIKSLEDTLVQSESTISRLSSANEEAESKSKQEIAAVNMKLAACLEELSANKGRFENQSSEFITHLSHLQMLIKEQDLLSLLNESFQTKFEDLRSIGLLLQNIRHQLTGKGTEESQFHLRNETHATKIFSVQPPEDENATVVDNEASTADIFDSIPSCLSKIVDGFNVQHKLLREKIEDLSSLINQHISYLLQMVRSTKDDVISTLKLMESLKLNVENLEAHSQAQENQISALQNSTNILLSACTDAAREFQNEVHTNISYQNSMPELESLNGPFYSQSREVHGYLVEEQPNLSDTNEYVKAAKDLLLSVRRVQGQYRKLEDTRSERLTPIEELQKKLKESEITAENAMQDRDFYLKKVSKLEGDLEALNNCCNELKLELEDYQEKEKKSREKEAQLSALHHSLYEKDQASENCFLSTNQVELLLEKLNKIEIISKDSEAGGAKSYFPDPVNKLFYIIDNFKEVQDGMDLLSHDKEELQLTLETQIHEIENMKREAEILVSNNQELESKRWDLEELRMGMDKIVQKLGGNDSSEEKKSLGAKGLLSVLEKLVANLILDCESYKSKSEELDAKLLEKQMSLDALSARVQLLQDSLHDRPASSDTIQEKSIFERSSLATGSEISEIEDVLVTVWGTAEVLKGSQVKNSIPPLPASALRTLRKGSSDHLALNIDMESDRLINHHESDDKGHVFKSLHTSGLVPKQGKLIADKIDGIW
ncbi:hypothetical protein ACLOJK_009265 [Asimina triloba]